MPPATKTSADHQVGEPDPAVEGVDGEQPDQGDGQQGDLVTTLAAKTMMPNTMARVTRVSGRTALSRSRSTTVSTASAPLAGGRPAHAGAGRAGTAAWDRASDPCAEDSPTWAVGLPGSVGARAGSVAAVRPRRDDADADGARAGVGADHRAEVDHHQGCSDFTSLEHGQEHVDVGGRTVAHGHAAERRGVHGLVGQVPQRPTAGALLGLLLHLAVDQGHHRLDGEQGAEQGPGPADPAALLQVLEGVDRPRTPGSGGCRRSTRATSSSRSAPVAGQLGGVQDHEAEPHGHRPRVDRPAPGSGRPPPWPRPRRPGRWPTPRRTG